MISISVVVPCRNERGPLAACLDALEAQDMPAGKREIIVVDGGSIDGSAPLARSRGVRLVHDEGRGPAAARNAGVRHAQGGIVAFTDADCVPARDWLTRIAEVFAEDPGASGVAGALRMPRKTLLGRMEDMDARVRYRGYITSNVAYRKAALADMGGFDERLCCAEDYDLAWRLLGAGHRIVRDPRPVVVHAPPELSGSFAGYLRKQAWYARHDVPTLYLALQRPVKPWGPARSAMAEVGWTAAFASLPFAPRVGGFALAGAAAASLVEVVRTTRAAGASLAEAPQMAAIRLAKRFARGLGTARGLVDLARERPALIPRAELAWGPGSVVVAPLRPRARAG